MTRSPPLTPPLTPPLILIVSNAAVTFRQFRKELIEDLVARNKRVVCASADGGDEETARIREMGAAFEALPLTRSGMDPFAELRLILKMFFMLRRLHPALIVTYTIKPNSYLPPLARLMGIPCISVATGLGYSFLNSFWRARLARNILLFGISFATKICFLNEDDRKTFAHYRQAWAREAVILPGEGVNMDVFRPAPPARERPLVFLMIGRLLRDKGVIEYAAAAKNIRKAYPFCQFNLMGAIDPDNPSAITRNELDELTRGGDVTYLGITNDVRPAIADAACIILPSYREGVPRVLLEAAAMCRPLIATNVSGCRDTVADGVNGFLCAPFSADSLAGAIEKFIGLSPQQRIDMGKAGRQIVAGTFDVKHVLLIYRRLMHEICSDFRDES